MSIKDFHDNVINLQSVDLTEYIDEIPEFKTMNECKQSAPHHEEGSVLVHVNMAAAVVLQLLNAEKIAPADQVLIYIATILHDIGKPCTSRISAKHGRITAYGHDEAGIKLSSEFLRKYFPEFNYVQREKVGRLIEYHMQPRWMKDKTASVAKLKMLSLAVNSRHLYLLSQADTLGRIAKDFMGGMFALELFKQNCEDIGIWDRPYRVPLATDLSDAAYSLARWNILINGEQENYDTYIKAQHVIVNPMKPNFQLMLLIGAPASGKSTVCEKLVSQYPGLTVISMDARRKELTGDYNDQSKNTEVFGWQTKELRKAMQARKNVIVDATNTSRKLRKMLWSIAREHGALCSAIYFDIPLATLHERNALRAKRVPDSVVEQFYKTMQTVAPWEADLLTIIDK